MKKTLAVFLLLLCIATAPRNAVAQQIPFLSELFSSYEEFNRLYSAKRRAGANLSAIEPLKRRGEEAFKRGSIPGILEALAEARAMLTGKKWDERERFIASLTLETDRLVIEPNQTLQVSLTRMFPASVEKGFASTPTVSFSISARTTGAEAPTTLPQPIVIAERLSIAETSTNSSMRLLLPDGVYDVVAQVNVAAAKVAEIKRTVYAISDFTDSIAQMNRAIAGIKASSDAKIKAILPLLATPEFQLQRLAQLNKSRGDVELNPSQEIDRIEAELGALSKGQDPLARQRGEVERAYRASNGNLAPYRVYVPKSYDGATAKPLVVMLHGVLGDERYYFSGLFDPSVIEGEAERRGWILVGVHGNGRFGSSAPAAADDISEVVAAMNRDYRIDASRIYLTGHSAGAFGAWQVAASKPDRFAAIAAVSGGPPAQGEALAMLLEKLRAVPVLLVHGAQDGVVPTQLSKSMSAAAEKAGLKVTYLEVSDGDHMSVVASSFPAIMEFFDKAAKSASAK